MKKLFTFLAVFIAFGLSAQTNIVTNGTFEDGSLTGWNTLSQNGAAMSVSAVGTNPLSGTKSMLVNITAVDATLQYWTQKISWRLSLTKNAVYKISFKAKASVATTLKGFINRYSWPWEAVSNNDYSLTTTSQNFEFTTNPISHVLGADYSFDFYVGQIPNGTQVWIDDVSIVEVTSPLTDGNLCNGDFENDVINSPYPFTNPQTLLSGWTENDYGRGYIQYSIDNTAPISGTNSFKAHSVNGPDDNGWRSQLMWQFTPIVGQKYMLEFDAKSDVNFSMNAEAFVEYTGSIRPNNLFNQAFNITTGTNHYKLTLPSEVVTQTPDLGPYTLAFWLGLLPTGNNVWIDNVKIYQLFLPILDVTSDVSSITSSTATVGGNVINNGRDILTSRGVCWSTSPNPTISNSKTNDGTSIGLFTSSITGLLPATAYYIKSYATNSVGTSYGAPVSFTTLANVPSAPSVNNATLNSIAVTINGNGNPTNTTFAIQETSTGNYVQADGTLGVSSVWQTASSWGTKTVTGLSANTVYSFKVKAINGASVESAFSGSASLSTLSAINVNNTALASTLPVCSTCDLVVSGTGVLTIDAAKTYNSVTVTPGGKLTLNSGKNITVTGAFTLQSDATGTATLVDNTTNAPQAVTAIVQQYVTSGRNWYMSIPLASGASSLLSRGTSVVCYDEPTSTWIAPSGNTLDKLRGYIQVATSTPSVTGTTGTVDFTGVVNTGSQSINLTRTAGKTGFNLVGNPYPSYLDWNAVTKTNVSNTLWYRTKEGGVYKFYTYVANSGAGVGSPATVTNKIPPMQAFWVRVNTIGTGSIAVDNTMRAHKDVAGNIMKAPSESSQKLLRLQVSNGVNTDETVLYFNANASDAFDQYDAQKRSNEELAVPEIYTQVGTEELVINGMSAVKYDTEIPIGFSTEQANDFSISANEITNFEAGMRVILIDKQNPSVETELTSGATYSFSAPVTAPTTNRFSLLFRAPGVATGVDNADKLNAQVFVNTANQIVVATPEKATVAIYNVMGQKQYENMLTSTKTTINKAFGAGIYFVALTVNGLSEVQKVIIK